MQTSQLQKKPLPFFGLLPLQKMQKKASYDESQTSRTTQSNTVAAKYDVKTINNELKCYQQLESAFIDESGELNKNVVNKIEALSGYLSAISIYEAAWRIISRCNLKTTRFLRQKENIKTESENVILKLWILLALNSRTELLTGVFKVLNDSEISHYKKQDIKGLLNVFLSKNFNIQSQLYNEY